MTIEQRIYKAVLWAEENLAEDFSSGDLSGIACLSEYHFRRMFTVMTGISPGMYIKRRRLSRAANMLGHGDSRIIDIALQSGFDSQEAFTRAFKEMFQTTPAQYRKDGIVLSSLMQPLIDQDYLHHLMKGTITMVPEIKTKEAFSVIGIGNDFVIGQTQGIPTMWDLFMKRRSEVRATGAVDYGICSKAQDKAASGSFHYTASTMTEPGADIPAGMEKISLHGGAYAVFTHKGHINQFEKTVEYVWKIWAPQNADRLAEGPDFEVYDERFDPQTSSGEVEIWVPVKI